MPSRHVVIWFVMPAPDERLSEQDHRLLACCACCCQLSVDIGKVQHEFVPQNEGKFSSRLCFQNYSKFSSWH